MNIRMLTIMGRSKRMPDVFKLRHEVYVIEQNVPVELEIDEFDEKAIHIVALMGNNIVGTLRIVKLNDYVKIGRVAVKKTMRGLGIGTKMMEKAIKRATKMGYTKIALDSQIGVEDFYNKLGFKKEGKIFMDAGIPHIRIVNVT